MIVRFETSEGMMTTDIRLYYQKDNSLRFLKATVLKPYKGPNDVKQAKDSLMQQAINIAKGIK